MKLGSTIRHLKHLASEEPTRNDTQIGLDLFLKSARLADGNVTVEHNANILPGTELTLSNNSTLTYAPGEFRIAVIAPAPFNFSRMESVKVTALPDGSYMHMLPEFDTLFPGAFTTLNFYLDCRGNEEIPAEFAVNLRIFSSAGLRDYPLGFRCVDA